MNKKIKNKIIYIALSMLLSNYLNVNSAATIAAEDESVSSAKDKEALSKQLIAAFEKDDVSEMERLIKAGADPNFKRGHFGILNHVLTAPEQEKIAKLLIEAGADFTDKAFSRRHSGDSRSWQIIMFAFNDPLLNKEMLKSAIFYESEDLIKLMLAFDRITDSDALEEAKWLRHKGYSDQSDWEAGQKVAKILEEIPQKKAAAVKNWNDMISKMDSSLSSDLPPELSNIVTSYAYDKNKPVTNYGDLPLEYRFEALGLDFPKDLSDWANSLKSIRAKSTTPKD